MYAESPWKKLKESQMRKIDFQLHEIVSYIFIVWVNYVIYKWIMAKQFLFAIITYWFLPIGRWFDGIFSAAEIGWTLGHIREVVGNYCANGSRTRRSWETWEHSSWCSKTFLEKLNIVNKFAACLIERKVLKNKGRSIYHKIQAELTYNSNHIEG